MEIDLWQVAVVVFAAFGGGILFKSRSLKQTMELFIAANSALREEVEYNDRRCAEKLADQATAHAQEVGDLRADYEHRTGELAGRVDTLQSHWMDGLGKQVTEAVDRGMTLALERREGNGTADL